MILLATFSVAYHTFVLHIMMDYFFFFFFIVHLTSPHRATARTEQQRMSGKNWLTLDDQTKLYVFTAEKKEAGKSENLRKIVVTFRKITKHT